jgi:2,4-dienoyl-CoA reductase-like NADH-dependent reductase (Old Yellow Enzyme family)
MTEGLGDAQLRATPEHVRLYAAWGAGGVGLNITGNVFEGSDPRADDRVRDALLRAGVLLQ